MTPEQQWLCRDVRATEYTKELEATGNVLVMAPDIGCIAVCADEGHADYVIRSLKSGALKIGEKGLERA